MMVTTATSPPLFQSSSFIAPILTAINAITIEVTMITSCLSPPTLMIAVSALLFDKLRIRSK